MRARAPGKVVISGAYAVLRGAPAIVAAVDRYASADDRGPAPLITDEVKKAIELGSLPRAPAFDSSPQRQDGRKLGLGSSAAILVASLWAMRPELSRDELFQLALEAHRQAQGGGSGIDVAASTYGGVLRYQLTDTQTPTVEPIALPSRLVLQVWASPSEARTSDLIARVAASERAEPDLTAASFERLFVACEAALLAARSNDAEGFVRALCAQADELGALGDRAGVPIITAAVRALGAAAAKQGAVVLPAGAGGGDVALFVGLDEPDRALMRLCEQRSHRPLGLSLGAPGAARDP
jgi:phosphomevalonate kinase